MNIEFVLPNEIEKRSFEIIGQELAEMGIELDSEQEPITKRVIHTTTSFEQPMEMSKNSRKSGERRFITLSYTS